MKDKNKAKLLLEMAKITLERLDKLDKLKYPSNSVNDYYDILHKLMESLSSIEGVKFSGINAHKNLIDFVSKTQFSEPDRIFLQNLRNYRNQISYEGFNVPRDFLERNDLKIRKYISVLIDYIEGKINDKE